MKHMRQCYLLWKAGSVTDEGKKIKTFIVLRPHIPYIYVPLKAFVYVILFNILNICRKHKCRYKGLDDSSYCWH